MNLSATEVKNAEELKTIMHFHTIFTTLVRPQMDKKYQEINPGKKMGFHVLDKDGNEILFEDSIIENASAKREHGTK